MCASGAAHYLFLAGDCMIEVPVLGHLPAQYLVYWYYSSMIQIHQASAFPNMCHTHKHTHTHLHINAHT